MKVEMHPAFVWDCDECGTENFARAVPDVVVCSHCHATFDTVSMDGDASDEEVLGG